MDEIVIEENENDEIIVEEEDNTEIEMSGDNVIYKTTGDYEELKNKPSINDVTLEGNKTSEQLNLQEKGNYPNRRVTNLEIDSIF